MSRAVDPILLTTPALFILAAGYLFLRLFPLVLGGLATILARVQGTAVLIGMWQLVRNPSHYSRLVLLLMLATAVGTFAASFGATVSRSYRDRAEYEAGAPIRLASLRSLDAAGPADLAATVASELGAESVSPVARLTGSAERLNFDIIGVDPASLGDVAYFRGDFASGSLSSILGKLAEDETPAAAGIALPADARWLGVWLNPVDLNGRSGLAAKLRDATGRYFIVDLGPTEGAELRAGLELPDRRPERASAELRQPRVRHQPAAGALGAGVARRPLHQPRLPRRRYDPGRRPPDERDARDRRQRRRGAAASRPGAAQLALSGRNAHRGLRDGRRLGGGARADAGPRGRGQDDRHAGGHSGRAQLAAGAGPAPNPRPMAAGGGAARGGAGEPAVPREPAGRWQRARGGRYDDGLHRRQLHRARDRRQLRPFPDAGRHALGAGAGRQPRPARGGDQPQPARADLLRRRGLVDGRRRDGGAGPQRRGHGRDPRRRS